MNDTIEVLLLLRCINTHDHLFVFCQALYRFNPKKSQQKRTDMTKTRVLVTPPLPEKSIILCNYMESRLNFEKQNGGLFINVTSTIDMDDLENNAEDLPDGN